MGQEAGGASQPAGCLQGGLQPSSASKSTTAAVPLWTDHSLDAALERLLSQASNLVLGSCMVVVLL